MRSRELVSASGCLPEAAGGVQGVGGTPQTYPDKNKDELSWFFWRLCGCCFHLLIFICFLFEVLAMFRGGSDPFCKEPNILVVGRLGGHQAMGFYLFACCSCNMNPPACLKDNLLELN